LLQTLAALLDQHPKAGIAYVHTELIDAAGHALGSAHHYLSGLGRNWELSFHRNGREEIAEYLGLLNTIPNASAVLFRREAYLQAGPANPALRSTGDWIQWFRILQHWDVAYCAGTLNWRRCHEASVTALTLKTVSGLADYLSVWRETKWFLTGTNRERLCDRLTNDLLALSNYPALPWRTIFGILAAAWRVERRAVMHSVPSLMRWKLKRFLYRALVAILGEKRIQAILLAARS
jgi:hypothetical protein